MRQKRRRAPVFTNLNGELKYPDFYSVGRHFRPLRIIYKHETHFCSAKINKSISPKINAGQPPPPGDSLCVWAVRSESLAGTLQRGRLAVSKIVSQALLIYVIPSHCHSCVTAMGGVQARVGDPRGEDPINLRTHRWNYLSPLGNKNSFVYFRRYLANHLSPLPPLVLAVEWRNSDIALPWSTESHQPRSHNPLGGDLKERNPAL